MDVHTPEEVKSLEAEKSKMLSNWDQIKMPGLHPSMSMSDLVSHIGHCISEKMTSTNPVFSRKQNDRSILEEITQYLFNDSQLNLASDDQSLMTRVNSLCCLLQKDPSANQLFSKTDASFDTEEKTCQINANSGSASESKRDNSIDGSDCKQAQVMSRKDSFGELLLSLPRIASLPQFLFNLSQDSDNQAR